MTTGRINQVAFLYDAGAPSLLARRAGEHSARSGGHSLATVALAGFGTQACLCFPHPQARVGSLARRRADGPWLVSQAARTCCPRPARGRPRAKTSRWIVSALYPGRQHRNRLVCRRTVKYVGLLMKETCAYGSMRRARSPKAEMFLLPLTRQHVAL